MDVYSVRAPGRGASKGESAVWEVWHNGACYKRCESEEHANSLSADLNMKDLLKKILSKDDAKASNLLVSALPRFRQLVAQSETGKRVKPEEPDVTFEFS